jgi:hypothetical protein
MPNQTDTEANAQHVEVGEYEIFTYQSETEAVTYMVTATTVPAKVDTSDPAEFLDGVQEGYVNQSKARLELSRDVSLNGTPGREVHTSMMNGAAFARGYIYFTPQVSYQVVSTGLKDEFQRQQAQIEKVLSSFHLVDK